MFNTGIRWPGHALRDTYLALSIQTTKTRRSQHNTIIHVNLQLTQTSIHVPLNRQNLGIRPKSTYLGRTAQAAGTYTEICSSFRCCLTASLGRDKSGTRCLLIRYEHVTDIFTGAGDHQAQFIRLGGRQIFQAVYCQVDTSLVESTFDLSNKNAIAADL